MGDLVHVDFKARKKIHPETIEVQSPNIMSVEPTVTNIISEDDIEVTDDTLMQIYSNAEDFKAFLYDRLADEDVQDILESIDNVKLFEDLDDDIKSIAMAYMEVLNTPTGAAS